MRTIKLNNGLEMPLLGLGVWQNDNGQQTIDSIHWALEAGYRHVDTARIYKNEEATGKAIASAKVPREEVWVTTKVWNEDIRQGRTTAAVDESLKRLGLDYVDLMLLHWPTEGRVAAWLELEEVLRSGKVRAIGVSNFLDEHLREIVEAGSVVPAVNQIEYHPYLVQADAISASDEHGTVITAWSPLMQGNFLREPVFAELGKKYEKSAAQIVLRWCIQNDVIVIPKSSNRERIRENGNLFDFEISEEDMVRIDQLERGKRFGPDPANFDF